MKEKSLTMESEKFRNIWVTLAHGDTSQWWTSSCPWGLVAACELCPYFLLSIVSHGDILVLHHLSILVALKVSGLTQWRTFNSFH